MGKLIGAMTKTGCEYPGYVNAKRMADGGVMLTVRGDPVIRDNAPYICGYAPRDKGKPGRCTPGDEHCNNYCNCAPEKGPMQAKPKMTTQYFEADTVMIGFTADEWRELLSEITAAE